MSNAIYETFLSMLTFPNAKINLGLNITEKRPDGYHNLETVFYPIPIKDALEIVPASSANHKQKCTLHLSGHALEGNTDDNLVTKAYRLLDKDFDLPPIEAHLLKHIPSGAGLGGGSSDAAFMLKMLNELFDLKLSEDQLESYATRLGADCAFFIRNRPTFAQGIGNLFSPIRLSLAGYQLCLVKPNIFVSTREAFARIKPRPPQISPKDIIHLPVEEWKEHLVNDFEDSVFPQFPRIGEIKDEMYRRGAIYAAMSGSGSSVYGLFPDNKELPEIDFGEGALVYQESLT